MQIYHGLDEVPAELGPTVLTIGNFDGVHLGHQHVLSQLVHAAQQHRAAAVAITFDPHPALVHRPESAPELLTGTGEKLARLKDCGIHAALVLDYTEELYSLSAEQFVQQQLLPLAPAAVVVGRDVRFGRGNEGDFQTLVTLGQQFGFSVLGVEDLPVTGPAGQSLGQRCSSTAVREAIASGDMAAAAQMLGRAHTVTGEVVHGEARGRELGFPTANLSQDSEGMVPADGVYAGWVTLPDHRWPAAISVGSNPTFEGVKRVVEAHVIDRQDARVEDFNLYGKRIRVEFVARLRGMVAYEGVEKLVEQMHQDVSQARSVLAGALEHQLR